MTAQLERKQELATISSPTKQSKTKGKAESSCRCRDQLITTLCPRVHVLGTVTQQHCSPRPSPLGAGGWSQVPARAAQSPRRELSPWAACGRAQVPLIDCFQPLLVLACPVFALNYHSQGLRPIMFPATCWKRSSEQSNPTARLPSSLNRCLLGFSRRSEVFVQRPQASVHISRGLFSSPGALSPTNLLSQIPQNRLQKIRKEMASPFISIHQDSAAELAPTGASGEQVCVQGWESNAHAGKCLGIYK